MRIFIGIDLDPEVRARIERFLEGVQGFAPDAKWVRPESLHVTLKFIGEQPQQQVEAITERLRRAGGDTLEISSARIRVLPPPTAPPARWFRALCGPRQTAAARGAPVAGWEIVITPARHACTS